MNLFLCRLCVLRLCMELFCQILPGIRSGTLCYFFRCSGNYQVSTLVSSFRTEVDNVVGTFDYVHVMLNDDNRMSAGYQRVEYFQQFLDVVKVKSGSRLVENKDGGLCFFYAEETLFQACRS